MSRKGPPRPPAAAGRPDRPARVWTLFAGLLAATLLAYQPAWHGGRLWDDNGHLTVAALQSWSGLSRIWFHVGATQQYYPVAHSAFWVMHALWGDATPGYHLVNIVLHAITATLIFVLLRRLAVPGAVLAAVLFALHPVHVESVAWMTELKNTLSGAFALAAALAYLSFDADRTRRRFVTATLLFLLALLSKTVTAVLPAALLVVVWWRRGRIRRRADAAPLGLWLALGAASGVLTAWVERTFIGAEGADFHATLGERALVAGHAIVFYLGKLVWPAPLMFNYPRWTVSTHDPLAYVYPLLVVAGFTALWSWRRRDRAPLAVGLLFAGILSPALGFVSAYPFLYSFVADHFQYLASIPILAAIAALLTRLSSHWGIPARSSSAALILVCGAPLGWLTWQQSHQYADAETLYRATLARNPDCWLCYNNLGVIEAAPADADLARAERDFRESLRLHPSAARTHNNLGLALLRLRRFAEARDEFAEAARLDADNPEVHRNLGAALLGRNQPAAAAAELREALRLSPDYGEAHGDLARVLETIGRLDEASIEYRESARCLPGEALPLYNLGVVLVRLGRLDDAEAQFRAALRLSPDYAEAHNNLGAILRRRGRAVEAVSEYREAVRLMPASGLSHRNLGDALQDLRRLDEALAEYQAARRDPASAGDADLFAGMGFALLGLGRIPESVQAFEAALKLQPALASASAGLARARARR